MPCSKYKGKQRALCFATKEWKDWENTREKLIKAKIKLGKLNLKEEKNNMEYKKKHMYGDRAKRAELCCKLGYPEGYYNMGMSEDDYRKIMMKRKEMKKMKRYHNMNGCKMR